MAKEGTIAIKLEDLLPYKELRHRWLGATTEEIAYHTQKGELRAYSKYKGPIQGVVWCENSQLDFKGIPDFVLKEDVAKLEQKNPEYIGKFSESNLPLANFAETYLQPLHDGMRLFSAIEVIKLLKITPIEFLDFINGKYWGEGENGTYRIRLKTTDEIRFQNCEYNDQFFNIDELSTINIYKKDLLNFCEQEGYKIDIECNPETKERLQKELDTYKKFIFAWKDKYKNIASELENNKAEHEATIADKDKLIADLQARLAEPVQDGGYASFFDAYPICREICELHSQGLTQGEIRTELKRRNRGTVKQIAFITKVKLDYQTDDALKQDFYRSIPKGNNE